MEPSRQPRFQGHPAPVGSRIAATNLTRFATALRNFQSNQPSTTCVKSTPIIVDYSFLDFRRFVASGLLEYGESEWFAVRHRSPSTPRHRIYSIGLHSFLPQRYLRGFHPFFIPRKHRIKQLQTWITIWLIIFPYIAVPSIKNNYIRFSATSMAVTMQKPLLFTMFVYFKVDWLRVGSERPVK